MGSFLENCVRPSSTDLGAYFPRKVAREPETPRKLILNLACEEMDGSEGSTNSYFDDPRRVACWPKPFSGDMAFLDPSEAVWWRHPQKVSLELIPVVTDPYYQVSGSVLVLTDRGKIKMPIHEVLEKADAVVVNLFGGVVWDQDAAAIMRAAWVCSQAKRAQLFVADGYGSAKSTNLEDIIGRAERRAASERFRYSYAVNFEHVVLPYVEQIVGKPLLPAQREGLCDIMAMQTLFRGFRQPGIAMVGSSAAVFTDYRDYEQTYSWGSAQHGKLVRFERIRNISLALQGAGLTEDGHFHGSLQLTSAGVGLASILSPAMEDPDMPKRWADSRYGYELSAQDREDMDAWLIDRFSAAKALLWGPERQPTRGRL